ncbi:MAG: nuclear transport factor 2 family protein [Pseudonocardiaceae bacterium]|nr:nuclear transport factor 2 family protein [Pseudonocardiaceae bacterium]
MADSNRPLDAGDVTTGQFRFHGRDQVRELLEVAFEVVSDIRFHADVSDGDTRVLFCRAHVGRHEFEEAQLLRLDAEGHIRELTLFGRPLPGLTALMAELGPRLVHRQQRPWLARLVGVATAPLAVMTRLGEQRIVPLVDPNRRN